MHEYLSSHEYERKSKAQEIPWIFLYFIHSQFLNNNNNKKLQKQNNGDEEKEITKSNKKRE